MERQPNFFDCVRIYNALDAMRKGKVTLDEVNITEEEVKGLIELGINIIYDVRTKSYYINPNSSENFYEVISLKTPNEHVLRWVELGALYAGHRTFDKNALEHFLSETVKRGYTEVHFSGDLCAGPPPKPNANNGSDWTSWTHPESSQQAQLIVDVLRKFPTLNYVAINGINELTFEKRKQINPLILVQRDLRQEGINFMYKPTTTLNLVVDGFVQRIVYLKAKRSYTISYQPEFYMDEQYAKMDDNVVIKGKGYKLMFVQFGGALENSLNKNGNGNHPIYMTTNGGLIRDTVGEFQKATTYPSIRFCDATIKNGKLVGLLKTSVCVL